MQGIRGGGGIGGACGGVRADYQLETGRPPSPLEAVPCPTLVQFSDGSVAVGQ